MARIRLTNKTKIANDPSDMEGVRQDCGKKTRFNKYTNFDPEKDDVGGRGKAQTDGSKLYEGDKKLRNQMHVTELKLKQAKMWQRSKLATKLAMYLLGEKAPQGMIKAQAAEFLSLGNEKLAKAVSRWAKTEYLYAEQEEKAEQEAPKAEAAQEEKAEQEAPKAEAEQEQVKEEAAQEEKAEQEAPKAEAPAQEEKAEQEAPKAEAPAQEACSVAEQEQVKEETAQGACPDCGSEPCTCEGCGDVVSAQPQNVVEQTAEEDELDEAALASLFEDNSNTLVANKKEAKSAKVGVQKFEQPQRTASNKISLDKLWKGAPDLSNIFN